MGIADDAVYGGKGKQKRDALPKHILDMKPTTKNNRIPVRHANGKILHYACLLCDGMVLDDGRVIGGWVPFVFVSEKGEIMEACAICPCVIGKWRETVYDEGDVRYVNYFDLDSDVRASEPKTAYDIFMHNLRQRGRLADKLGLPMPMEVDRAKAIDTFLKTFTEEEKAQMIGEMAGEIGTAPKQNKVDEEEDELPF